MSAAFPFPSRKARPIGLALAFLPFLALTAPARANLVQNPSFEVGPAPGEALSLAVGSTALANWVVTRNAIDYCGTRLAACGGERCVSLNGTNPGGVAQTFATFPGAEYTARFFVAGDPFTAPLLKNLRVTAAGQSKDIVFDSSHSWPWGPGWVEETFVFDAVAANTTLEFYSLDAGADGPTVDSVDVVLSDATSVPPGSQAGFSLAAPAPNPSRSSFRIGYVVPVEGGVRIAVTDVMGREVAVIAEGVHPAGRFSRTWDGRIAGARAPAGLYFVRMRAAGVDLVRRAVLSP